jgi:outer membrane protein insertion porin family
VDKDLIKGYFQGFPSNPTQWEVSEKIRSLYELDFFSQIYVEYDQEKNDFIWHFVERPFIKEVEIRGISAINEEKWKGKIPIQRGTFLTPKKIQQTEEFIKKLYEEEKEPIPRISVQKEQLNEKNEVRLTVEVEEEEEWKVLDVKIYGAEQIPLQELLKELETRPRGPFSFLTREGIYHTDSAERDRYRIEQFYLKRGFLKVKVDGPIVSQPLHHRGVIVEYRVSEGKPYKVGEIRIGKQSFFPPEKLREKIPLMGGEIFDRIAFEEGIQKIVDAFGEYGFAFARVDPKFSYREEENLADVELTILPGKPVFIRRIEITGNTRTRDKVIRREILLHEGELFHTSRVRESRERIFALGFFDAVTIETKGVGEDQIDLVVQVTERPTGTASAGVGYSSIDRFVGTVRVNFGNFLGYGLRLDFIGEFGGRRRSLIFSYTDPYFLDSLYSLGVDLNFSQQEFFSGFLFSTVYTQETRGGRITLGRKLGIYNRIFLGVRAEKIQFLGLPFTQTPFFSGGETRSLTLTLRRDTRNHPFDPSKGHIVQGSVEWAGKPLMGDFLFTKYDFITQFFHTLFSYLTFSTRGEIALATTPGERVPFAERYFLGGIFTLRGYNFRTVGPKIYIPENPSIPGSPLLLIHTGGNKMFLVNNELLFPLIPPAGIKGVLFLDLGNVWEEEENFFSRPLRSGYGFGIRWFSPIGPLRFEWSFPYKPLPDEPPRLFDFTIGTFF